MADPSQAGATNRASYPAFERTAAEVEMRVTYLIRALNAPRPTRRSKNARP
jgi:hypothetical protein